MPGRIRDEDIALVRERSPIDEVVGEYLQLRNAGGGALKALCPFHEERTPSFNVTPSRGLYYCFSCADGGDVITFVQKIDNLTFAEAVERLAARAGVELRYEQGGHVPGREQGMRRRLLEAHRAAADFYAERLSAADAGPARAFLTARGFARAEAGRFGVGYAPDEWEALTRYLRRRGFTDRELLTGGLAREGRRGPVDRFRGRLIWPIRDLSGDVIAFGARKLAGTSSDTGDGPKYLNSPETPLFKKGSVLYGADLAKREIAQRRQAVIVEGYTDVMACHLAGVPTAVATSGTSFGDGHVKILRRLLMDTEFRGEVIFTFDGDAAGQRAALRAFDTDQRFVTQTFVAVQPDGLDPCDLRMERGDAAVRDLIARRVPLFEFAIRSVLGQHNLDTTEGQLAALDAAAPLVAGIKDTGLRKRYAVNLDRWLGLMDERFVLQRVGEHSGRGRPGSARQRDAASTGQAAPAGSAAPVPGARGGQGSAASGRLAGKPEAGPGQEPFQRPYDGENPAVQVERELLKLAVQRPALCGPDFDALDASAFTAPAHNAVRELIAHAGGMAAAQAGDGGTWAARLRDAAPGEAARAFVTRLAVEPLRLNGEADARYAGAVVARVGELDVSRRIVLLKSRLQRLNPVEDQAEYNRTFGDLVALEQRRKVLWERAVGAL